MKLTPDTKVKDLIPEGYEIDESTEGFFDKLIYFRLKAKPEKDFWWYVNQYYEQRLQHFTKFEKDEFYNYLEIERYNAIPFEVRIGLLKFICDDLGIGLLGMYSFLKTYHMDSVGEAFEGIINIIPEEFLDSLTE